MKTKKLCIIVALCAMSLGLLALFFTVKPQVAFKANALSSSRYHAEMEYVYSIVTNGVKRTKYSGRAAGLQLNMSEYGKTTIGLSFVRNDKPPMGNISYEAKFGDPFSYHDFTISYSAGFKTNTMSLYDDTGKLIASDNQNPTSSISVNLDDGHYHIEIVSVGYPWNSDENTHYLFEAIYDFCIDNEKPYFDGAVLDEENALWVKVGHTVTARDDMSGPYLFYKYKPGKKLDFYTSDFSSYTFSDEDIEGTYMFMVYDKAMLESPKYYVRLDKTTPSGYFCAENGEIIETDGTIKQSFSFQSTDELSGLREIKYKTPSSDTWKEYTSGTIIPNNAPMGKYEFWCIDVAGNESIYSINLSHDFVAKVTAPTCSTGGFTTYTCNDCGYSYVGDQLPALGHKYSDTRVAATCTEKGYTLHRCERCNNEYRDTPVRELGHDMQPSTILPSCTESGYLANSCTRCDESNRTETAKPLGHNYITHTAAATCTEGGYTLHECTRCGDSYKDNVSQPNGHNFIVSRILPTCTEYGKTQYECQVCEYCYADNDGTYPTGHSYTISMLKEPTCTEEGLRRFCCENCGHTYDTTIASNGHEYEIVDVESVRGRTTRTYTCKICEEKYRQELGNQYEEVSNYVEYLFNQYEPYMWCVLLATAGIWSIAIGVMIAIAQKHEDKEKAKKMLVNYMIGLVVIAVIVVACPYLVRGIAALIT